MPSCFPIGMIGGIAMKMKRFLTLFAALCLTLALCTAAALADAPTSGTCGMNLSWSLDAATGTLTISRSGDGSGAMNDFTSSGTPWYASRESITRVVLGSGVTSVGRYAFYNCVNLKSVTLPSTVSSLGGYAFYGCVSLTDPEFPDVLGNVGDSTFYSCDNLRNIVLPASVTAIAPNAFYDCDRLTRVTMPGVTRIDGGAFDNCNHLQCVTLSKALKNVYDNAFRSCDRLHDVYYMGEETDWNSVSVSSGNYCLTEAARTYNAPQNSAIVSAPNVTWTVERDTLYIRGTGDMYEYDPDCADSTFIRPPWYDQRVDIAHIVIASGVTSICDNAFAGLNCAEDVVIPNTVAYVGSNAFSGCTALKAVSFPDSVSFIWGSACKNCTALESARLPSGIRNDIRPNLFEGCKALKSIVIPETVTRIWQSAFSGCTALTDPVIPAGVTDIGDNAFKYCENLLNIVLPASVKTVGSCAFYYCDRLTRVTMPDVTTIGASAFEKCSHLQCVTLSKALTYVNGDAFKSCDRLHDVYYMGTETNWSNLGIGSGNYRLTEAALTCNASPDSALVEGAPNVTWAVQGDTLYIRGTGDMYEYDPDCADSTFIRPPWYDQRVDIVHIVIASGVTSICDNAFAGLNCAEDVVIPNTVA
ncbi:MAG: leucine-rich repeat domain-containing protein, partial [Ruminococcaceae bacterium]|nr:leucine-rich repeat domain-containing protein [Oscillospiraceae bacterium]